MENLKQYAKSIRKRKYNAKKYFKNEIDTWFVDWENCCAKNEKDIDKITGWRKLAFYACIYLVALPYHVAYTFYEVVIDLLLGNATLKEEPVKKELDEETIKFLTNLKKTNLPATYLDEN